MATQTPKTETTKTTKLAKPPVPAAQRITELMKRGALQGKLTAQELDTLSNLASALKTFVSA